MKKIFCMILLALALQPAGAQLLSTNPPKFSAAGVNTNIFSYGGYWFFWNSAIGRYRGPVISNAWDANPEMLDVDVGQCTNFAGLVGTNFFFINGLRTSNGFPVVARSNFPAGPWYWTLSGTAAPAGHWATNGELNPNPTGLKTLYNMNVLWLKGYQLIWNPTSKTYFGQTTTNSVTLIIAPVDCQFRTNGTSGNFVGTNYYISAQLQTTNGYPVCAASNFPAGPWVYGINGFPFSGGWWGISNVVASTNGPVSALANVVFSTNSPARPAGVNTNVLVYNGNWLMWNSTSNVYLGRFMTNAFTGFPQWLDCELWTNTLGQGTVGTNFYIIQVFQNDYGWPACAASNFPTGPWYYIPAGLAAPSGRWATNGEFNPNPPGIR